MDSTSIDSTRNLDNQRLFTELVFGLYQYADHRSALPPENLRRAMNVLSFEMGKNFPISFYALIRQCHTSTNSWYPLSIPEGFNPSQPLLFDYRPSDESQAFCLDVLDRLDLGAIPIRDIPQSALDGQIMHDFRRRLNAHHQPAEAQRLYDKVRSFIINNSWATLEQLRKQSRAVYRELTFFYEELPEFPVDMLPVCEQCGLLIWQDGSWSGVKPNYCSDHDNESPLIHWIPVERQMYRLKRHAHIRTFLPGQLELALFTFADEMQIRYPDYLLGVARYPGLDAYDLQLSFSDGEKWAVDAKDHTKPETLAAQIKPLYNEGDLSHTEGFYVIPDRRMEDDDYREWLERLVGKLPPKLYYLSLAGFQERVEEKLLSLAKATTRKDRR